MYILQKIEAGSSHIISLILRHELACRPEDMLRAAERRE
jgi:hypothetical protein